MLLFTKGVRGGMDERLWEHTDLRVREAQEFPCGIIYAKWSWIFLGKLHRVYPEFF